VSAKPSAESQASKPADDLETRLSDAFDAEPTPAQLAAIDGRVLPALRAPRAAAEPAVRRIGRSRRRWGSVLLAAAALVLLVGVVAAGTTLLSAYPLSTQGGFGLAWDRATKLGLSQVHDGYEVKLEAAYADAAQTMLAISVFDTNSDRNSHVSLEGRTVLTDESGRVYQTDGGIGVDAAAASSISQRWFVTPGDGSLSGLHHFTLDIAEIGVYRDGVLGGSDSVWGPWMFAFDLEIAPGTRISPGSSATAGGITVTLDSVLITPTTIRSTWSYTGLATGESAPIPVFTVLHDGKEIPGAMSGSNLDDPGHSVGSTDSGVDDPSGSWTIRIDELVRGGPENQTRLQGPWDCTFTLP
jgi:hypothetical protein